MDKQDISDAMDFLDEDMIRHTELLRKKHAREARGNGKKGERLRFGVAAVACVLLLGILVALMVFTLNRGRSTGQEEQEASMTAENNGEVGTENMTASNPEADDAEMPEDFVAIETLLARLEQEEESAFKGSTTMDMIDTIWSAVELGEYVGLYEVIYPTQSEGGVLSESMGSRVTGSEDAAESTESEATGSESLTENTGTELPYGYYRVAGHEDLQYLICKGTSAAYTGEGTSAEEETDCYTLMKFVCFESEEYPYSNVLSLVYQIHSAEDIAQILVKPSKADNTDTGKALQDEIGESAVTDAEDIEAFYEILSSLTCYGSGRWDMIDLGNWEVAADSTVNGDSQIYSRVLVERYLTLTTDYGNEIDGLKYTAYSDMFYEFSGIAYSALDEEQAELIREILGIDADGAALSSISGTETEVFAVYASDSSINLAYVTELQEKVSTAMVNGELPHVSSSSVYENPYRLCVTALSTITEEELEKLQSYDTLGALEIEVGHTENGLEDYSLE